MATPNYRIVKCIDGSIIISDERLSKLFEEMPILKMILIGHDNMKINNDKELTFHKDLNINYKGFTNLLMCSIGICEIPNDPNEQNKIITMANALGGCSSLEEKIKLKILKKNIDKELKIFSMKRQEAISPVTDIHNIFEWISIGPQYCYQNISNSNELHSKGFQYISSQPQVNHTGVVIHHFRRPRT